MLEELLSARPGTQRAGEDAGSERGINFTMFLTMMSERLFEFDTEAELVEAFGSFDEDDSGTVRVDEMRKWLSEVGERMTEQEVRAVTRDQASADVRQMERLLKGPFTDREGNFNYREWVKVLRVNDADL